MAVFQCRKCGNVVRNSTMPQNSATCEGKQFHSWIKLTEDGDATYECRKCGLTIERCKSTPQSTATCENKQFHSWHKL
jgi:predicted RNA-binding Zn-ribbon protein involved in translation (DUF1610 family)